MEVNTFQMTFPMFDVPKVESKNKAVIETRQNGLKSVMTTLGAANFRQYEREQMDLQVKNATRHIHNTQNFDKII